MSKYKHLRAGSKTVKKNLYDKDNRCFKCGKHFKLQHLQLHHLKPVRNGGNTTEDNCVNLCANCHSEYHRKYDSFLNRVVHYYESDQYKRHLKEH